MNTKTLQEKIHYLKDRYLDYLQRNKDNEDHTDEEDKHVHHAKFQEKLHENDIEYGEYDLLT